MFLYIIFWSSDKFGRGYSRAALEYLSMCSEFAVFCWEIKLTPMKEHNGYICQNNFRANAILMLAI